MSDETDTEQSDGESEDDETMTINAPTTTLGLDDLSGDE